MDANSHNSSLDACLSKADVVQDQLAMCSFQLKTLNDISKELFESVDVDTILKNFLFNTTGNFGVIKGFLYLLGSNSRMAEHFTAIGIENADQDLLQNSVRPHLLSSEGQESIDGEANWESDLKRTFGVELIFPFAVADRFQGLLGLGPKLMDPLFSDPEKEMLETMINNLVVAIKNAWSFKKVMGLNQRLRNQNVELEEALQELKASLKKIELLTNIKENLSKFVPNTVSNMIAASPEGALPDSKEQDVSVLFLDIHMGIHSGRALVGATKFSSITGSRWTYTARGSIVNEASRISSLARGNNILISRETAERVRPYNAVKSMGRYKLKNVSEEVEVYKLLSQFRGRTKH